MSSSNNFTHSDLLEIIKTWHDKKLEGDYSIGMLFRISTALSNNVQRIFTSYVQPPITLLTIFIIVFLTYSFVKEKMIGIVNVLLILSNVFEVIPSLIIAPIQIVFYFFADITVPMPYPWCYIYLTADESVNHLVHTVTLNLKILLAVNRLCSVYFPFKYSFWFTPKRCAIYIMAAISLGATAGGLLNFTFEKIKKQEHVDDVWGTGRVEWYTACSLESNFVQEGSGNDILFVTKIIQLSISMICVLALFVIDVFLIIKIRKQRKQREALSEGRSAVKKQADKKLDLLNKVSIWVIWVVIISEIPQMMVKIYAIYLLVFWNTGGLSLFEINGITNSIMSSIGLLISSVLTPADMIVFTFLSDKMKSRLKKMFCCCCKDHD